MVGRQGRLDGGLVGRLAGYGLSDSLLFPLTSLGFIGTNKLLISAQRILERFAAVSFYSSSLITLAWVNSNR